MALFLVTPTDRRTPPARFTATDLIHLGEQIAGYLTRHHVLVRGAHFDAQIGDHHGAIRQHGRVVTFQIAQES